ncbi:hypothetical protein L208DRAFT_335975 [Tricholoma matsutake]|nr:hypothetical protein L208DRAFT_335975 [Tricholoma matsutake 945]
MYATEGNVFFIFYLNLFVWLIIIMVVHAGHSLNWYLVRQCMRVSSSMLLLLGSSLPKYACSPTFIYILLLIYQPNSGWADKVSWMILNCSIQIYTMVLYS